MYATRGLPRVYLLVLALLLVWFGGYCWTHRVRQFRGTVQCDLLSIPEDPCTGVALITADGTYELDLADAPPWNGTNLRQLQGQQVIVSGPLRVWQGPFVLHRRIRVRDVQLIPLSPPAPSP